MYDLNIPGFMPEEDLIQIEKWASQVPENGIIVEVGSFRGRSTVAWASSCPSSVKVYAIDTFSIPQQPENKYFYDEFLENTKNFSNITSIRTICPYLLTFTEPEVDLLFLDMAHSNPYDIDTIKFFLPKMKKGGLLCGHDYEVAWPDVIENANWLEQELGKPVTLYPNSTLWSFRI